MVFLFSDGLLAQTLKTACVRSAHILLVEFKFHMGYGLLLPVFRQICRQRFARFAKADNKILCVHNLSL